MSGGQVWNGDEYDSQYMTAKAVPDYVGKIPDEIIYRLNYTQEEADSIAEFQANRDTLLNEAVAAFVTGTRPIDDFDNFVAEMQSIGLDNFLQVAQTAYDRMQSSSEG